MALKAGFNGSEAENKLNAFSQKIIAKHIKTFEYIGESFTNEAKQSGSYIDRTGNLRSSIGYMVALNGEIVNSKFEGKADKGKQQGETFANQLLNGNKEGLVLICVAGMEYAVYVEAKGREVITSTSLIMSENLKNMIKNTR